MALGRFDIADHIGSALGIAIVTSVALSLTAETITHDPSATLTAGLSAAFLTATVLAGLGLLASFLLPDKPSPAENPRQTRQEAVNCRKSRLSAPTER